jgi:hypothetical protein
MNQKKNLLLCAAALAAIVPAVFAPSASASIADIYTNGTAGSPYTESGVVSAILNTSASSNSFVITDGTASVLAYSISKTTYTAQLGDTINFTATNAGYQNSPELVTTGFAVNADIPSTPPGTQPAPADISVPTFNASGNATAGVPPYSEAYVEIDGVTINGAPATLSTNTNYVLTDASSNTMTMYPYASDSLVKAAVTAANAANPGGFGGTYDIIGYADEYYGAPEIYPLSIIAVPEPASISLLALGGISMLARRRRIA